MFVRAYLRASTLDQDAHRAASTLDRFVESFGLEIAASYIENVSGTSLDRPELLRLLRDARDGDILLVESIDRLSRLPASQWDTLRAAIDAKGMKIVSTDLPTSFPCMEAGSQDEFSARVHAGINRMMIDIMAALARQDWELKHARIMQGVERAKANGLYRGRPKNKKLHARIRFMLQSGVGIREIGRRIPCSTSTVLRVRRDMDQETKRLELDPAPA